MVRLHSDIDPLQSSQTGKRFFDLALCLLTVWIWLPALGLCSLAIYICSGRPIFYLSKRRVSLRENRKVIKFRCMVRNAESIANRDTIPVNGQRFLNIPFDSPLYTRIGSLFEKMCFTELPQIFHVLCGQMSVIGNRPLPENVIASLREVHPHAERRFLTKAGLTGPAQLVGRTNLEDGQRLRLESEYCRLCLNRWSPRLDIMILLYTVMIASGLMKSLSPEEVELMMLRYARRETFEPVMERDDTVVPGGAGAHYSGPARRMPERTLVTLKSAGN